MLRPPLIVKMKRKRYSNERCAPSFFIDSAPFTSLSKHCTDPVYNISYKSVSEENRVQTRGHNAPLSACVFYDKWKSQQVDPHRTKLMMSDCKNDRYPL